MNWLVSRQCVVGTKEVGILGFLACCSDPSPFILFYFNLFIFIHFLRHVGSFSHGMHVGSSSPTRDRTRAPCIGSTESYPLDHQGSPLTLLLTGPLLWVECGCLGLLRHPLRTAS